ncbi:hypothetical protein LWC34_29380 [Kibdelosporangium philippinense]|uniref:Uncharacterized protein n=1 Tax=Kibdelosporangium philippinense TaxID=211113 RepID=A0ABS8ZHS0_9PSEU|nr:hypothetical protein [Kibdelosporangium philippinense]MCE7006909.1 hypothetical protein [Kibdelosporangium philippinense]
MDTHEERVLNARLGSLNSDLARFVVAVIDADHQNKRWPHTREAESELGTRLVEVGRLLLDHAQRLPSAEPIEQRDPRVIEGAFQVRREG